MNKRELIKILKKEQEQSKQFAGAIIIVESKKISDELGILKGEIYIQDKLEYSGGMTVPIEKENGKNAAGWEKMKVGESEYHGIFLQARGKSFLEKVAGFVKRSLEESKFQDIVRLIK